MVRSNDFSRAPRWGLSQLCLNLSRMTSYTGTLRQAGNTGMESLDLFLVDFLKREL